MFGLIDIEITAKILYLLLVGEEKKVVRSKKGKRQNERKNPTNTKKSVERGREEVLPSRRIYGVM